MATANPTVAPSSDTLSELFDRGLKLHNDIIASNEPANSNAFQSSVQKAILLLEDATRLVSMLDVFSRNEDVKEVAPEHLKFFLLPALLGDLQSRLQEDGVDRESTLDLADIYYRDFLQRCNDYNVCSVRVPEKKSEVEDMGPGAMPGRPGPPNPEQLARMNKEREAKIARFKARKELESRLQELQGLATRSDADPDVVREYYTKTLHLYVSNVLDEMASFEQERPMLRHMKKVLEGRAPHPKDVKGGKAPRPLQPIIITKDKVQKEVYGLGYKNIPILSIEEFYEQRVRDGWFPDPSKTKGKSLMAETEVDQKAAEEEEERVKEEKLERGDPAEMERLRNWDEYKDDHKRGEGNRHNKG